MRVAVFWCEILRVMPTMAAAHERFLGRCIGRLAEALIDFPICPPMARPSTSAVAREVGLRDIDDGSLTTRMNDESFDDH